MSPTFPEWLSAVFDHRVGKPDWYWASDFDSYWEAHTASDELSVEYMTQLFTEHRWLGPYSLEQVAQGIWFLVGESSPSQLGELLVDSAVPLENRVHCIAAMAEFFRGFVAAAAPGESQHDTDPFHIACYMWWDIFPYRGQPEASSPEIRVACLRAMRDTLRVPSELCQVSALHGLNHWHMYHAAEVEQAVEEFLGGGATLSPRLREYAHAAWGGLAQ